MKIEVIVWINGTRWMRSEYEDCDVTHNPSVIRDRVVQAAETLMNDISDTSIERALKGAEEGGE